MTILNKLSIKNLKLNKKRTISTIIGIILSVALICGVATLVTSFQETLVQSAIENKGYYHIKISEVTDENIKELENNRDILDIKCVNEIGYSVLEGSTNEYKPYLKLCSMSEKVFKELKFKLIEGQFPKNSNEVIISNHILSNGGVKYNIGDKIKINVGKRMTVDEDYELRFGSIYTKEEEKLVDTKEMEFTIVGIIERPNTGFEPYSDAGYTIITKDDIVGTKSVYIAFKDVFNYKESLAKIFEVKEYSDIHKEQLMGNLKYPHFSLNDELLRWEAFSFSDTTISMLYSVACVVMFIIIFTSVFCIRNSFAIATTEKIKMYGMLASVGTTKKQIRKNVITEALILGIIGIPLGIVSGIFAIYILLQVVNAILGRSLFGELDGMIFSVSIIPIIISSILGLVVIYFSAISSAKKASKVSPIESLRNSKEIKIKSKKLKTPKIISNLFKTGGVLAYKNLKRSRKKYRTTVISITVSIFIFITMNSFLTNAFGMARAYYTDYDYNIEIYSSESGAISDDEFVESIRKLDTVDEVYAKYDTYYSGVQIFDTEKINSTIDEEPIDEMEYDEENNVKPTGRQYLIAELIALDDYSFKKYCEKIGVNYNDIKADAILCDEARYYDEEGRLKIVRRYNYKENDIISGEYNKEAINIKIGKISNEKPYSLENTYYGGGFIIVNKDYYKNINFDLNRICIQAKNAEKAEEEIKNINNNVNIINFDAQAKEERSMVLVINIFLYGFITVITLIGVTNIFNTITSNMELRQREFATLKSIGMTKKEFNRMINLETIFYSTKALLYGIILGLLGTFAIYKAFDVKFNSGMYIPVIPILISIIFVFILVYVIMKYSIKRINKQNIIETIRKENI